MSPIEQRIAIAEACGWTNVQEPIMFSALMDTPAAHAPGTSGPSFSTIPDYLNDLNAMREAEVMLAEDLMFNAYESALDRVVPMSQRWILATAAQRAEAFLRTIGKWVES